jgi:hypothetical protein
MHILLQSLRFICRVKVSNYQENIPIKRENLQIILCLSEVNFCEKTSYIRQVVYSNIGVSLRTQILCLWQQANKCA